MSVSRRHFLVAGQSLIAAAALPRFLSAAESFRPGSDKTVDLTSSTMASFLPLVNSSFAVGSGSLSSAWLTLLSVESMNANESTQAPTLLLPRMPKSQPARLDTFALHFYGTGGTLEQGTYELQHHTLGRFALFIVPSGVSTYVAIINHLLSPSAQPPVKAKPQRASSPAVSESL